MWVYGAHFYGVTDTVVTWSDAEAQAAALGGHLVTIDDQAEQDWLTQTFGRFGNVWIGLSDQAVTNTWEWSSGDPLAYTNWAPGQPSYYNSYYGYHWAFLQAADGQWSIYPNGAYFRGLIELEGTDSDGDGVPDALDVAPNDPRNTWDLREAGPDGVFDTVDDVLYHLSVAPPYTAGTSVSVVIDDGPLADGHYRLRVAATITDRVGNRLDGNRDGVGGDAYEQVFDIAGTAPAGIPFEGRNNETRQTATALTLTEDPAGSGYWMGRGVGSIDPATQGNYWSDTDYWSFVAQAGDVVSVGVDTAGSGLNPYVELHDAADNSLAGDSDAGPGYDAFISHYVIPTSGTYYVKVGHDAGYYSWNNSTPGSYQLRVDVARGIQLESDANYANDSVGGSQSTHISVRSAGAPGRDGCRDPHGAGLAVDAGRCGCVPAGGDQRGQHGGGHGAAAGE